MRYKHMVVYVGRSSVFTDARFTDKLHNALHLDPAVPHRNPKPASLEIEPLADDRLRHRLSDLRKRQWMLRRLFGAPRGSIRTGCQQTSGEKNNKGPRVHIKGLCGG